VSAASTSFVKPKRSRKRRTDADSRACREFALRQRWLRRRALKRNLAPHVGSMNPALIFRASTFVSLTHAGIAARLLPSR
jgi:hypothetical protein